MKILLDTHCWLWMQVSPDRFRPEALELVRDTVNELVLSAASSWEIAIKHAIGKLELPEPPVSYVPSRMKASAVSGLSVEHAHALRVSELPLHHRDPFDRVLVAQAQIESLPILTSDGQLDSYDVETLVA